MNPLCTELVRPDSLSDTEINTLFVLYATYYGGTAFNLFEKHLFAKDYVLILRDERHAARGFTSLKIIPFTVSRSQAAVALFSGDTIIDHRFWGTQTLPQAWCRLAGRIQVSYPGQPLFWFLIAKGDRTYRFLNIFSKNYYPNRHQETPRAIQTIIDHLASTYFGKNYDPEQGLVRFPKTQGYLKPQWIKNLDGHTPEARFFIHRNPRYAEGEELVCLTHLSEENLRKSALTAFQRGLSEGPLPGKDVPDLDWTPL